MRPTLRRAQLRHSGHYHKLKPRLRAELNRVKPFLFSGWSSIQMKKLLWLARQVRVPF
jgi:hypothetical protein